MVKNCTKEENDKKNLHLIILSILRKLGIIVWKNILYNRVVVMTEVLSRIGRIDTTMKIRNADPN